MIDLPDNWSDKSAGDLFEAAHPSPPSPRHNLALALNWKQRQAYKVLVEVFGEDQVELVDY